MQTDSYEEALAKFTEASYMEDNGNLLLAIELYKESASLNFTPAYTNLGNIFDDKIEPRDPEKAIFCYMKAVNLGDALGAYCLAMHYRNLGDHKSEKHWSEVASDMGYSNT